MRPLSAPPSSKGWLSGGLESGFGAVGVVEALLVGAMLELTDLFPVVMESLSEGCFLISSGETSFWRSEERAGEVDLLLAASPLPPPREEFRGETLPICHNI
jgi:hypothetical protein